ncbi:hypothetical protein DFH09DRAFT_945744 [Mycena vulgaris]|nr:hypothetical protein DFH09DRAFT_945744 [Mycena vulgaris]
MRRRLRVSRSARGVFDLIRATARRPRCSPPRRARGAAEDAERVADAASVYPRLRTVILPHATLPCLLSIASASTARNLETCRLFLGREIVDAIVGGLIGAASGKAGYVVETLLIPQQDATSDTCTMNEEEGVLAFTEARELITLGWIHTHPSQSCFMSSVDLHTHAGHVFPRMLAESFTVVCAPKSDSKYIFCLTDLLGLQFVLEYTAKQAFHPHPDFPIYTDADKGHVQIHYAGPEVIHLH